MRIIRILIAVSALLFVAQPALAQFGQANRLTDLADRLSRDSDAFADTTYSAYSNSFRSNRNDVEAVMVSQQFAGASRIFYRMVVDRRRNQDLRDAFGLLTELARSVERNTQQRTAWNNVQRTMTDLSRELSVDSSGGGGGGNEGPGGGRSGSMTWRGRVDDDVRITIRGGSADVETIGGTPYSDSQPNFNGSLPFRRVTVRLTVRKARGQVYIEEQPTRENNFTAVIRIKDPRGGASDYEFELNW
ncbi:MAG TPA: hypothetical protein VFY51_06120 [Pyrinomonadaceae bacterium]|nr:hypothetical protein [Pyrinomonadaceae bacterium]